MAGGFLPEVELDVLFGELTSGAWQAFKQTFKLKANKTKGKNLGMEFKSPWGVVKKNFAGSKIESSRMFTNCKH